MKGKSGGAPGQWLRDNVLGLVAIFIALTGTAFAAQGSGGGDQAGEATSASLQGAAVSKAKKHVKRGPRGFRGRRGPIGRTGKRGAIGPRGLAGLTGPAGPTGSVGATGATGPAGASIANFSCEPGDYVSGFDAEGQPVCGIAGPTGPTGPTG